MWACIFHKGKLLSLRIAQLIRQDCCTVLMQCNKNFCTQNGACVIRAFSAQHMIASTISLFVGEPCPVAMGNRSTRYEGFLHLSVL